MIICRPCPPVCIVSLTCLAIILQFRPNVFGNISQPPAMLRSAASTATLRPRTPMSIATSQEPTHWQWDDLHWALECPGFVTLLYILVFGLDPSQAGLLKPRSDLSHIFDPQHSLPQERYATLQHLYRMATSAADEPVLELCSVASRLEVWRAFHQSVLKEARPLTILRFGSVEAGDIQSFLNRIGCPMDLSEVLYWTGRLWHTLPFEPPWHFPFSVDLTLEQEGQVTTALGTLQGILEGVAWDPAFDLEFLTPIALSQLSWSSPMLEEWSQTAQAAEMAFQAAHRILECRTDRQGMVFLVVVVMVHYFQWRFQPRIPHLLDPPSLMFDFSEKSFCRSLEALTSYVDLFSLHGVFESSAFVLVRSLRPIMSLERAKEWCDSWRGCLPSTLVDSLVDHEDGNESVVVCSGKEADLPDTGKAWFSRFARFWPCFNGND